MIDDFFCSVEGKKYGNQLWICALGLWGFGAGAVISSQIAGYYKNISAAANDINLMFPAFVIALCCAAAGIVMMLVLRKIKRQLPAGEIS